MFFKGSFLRSIILITTCNAATGQKGTTKNRNQTKRRRHRGWKVQEGKCIKHHLSNNISLPLLKCKKAHFLTHINCFVILQNN